MKESKVRGYAASLPRRALALVLALALALAAAPPAVFAAGEAQAAAAEEQGVQAGTLAEPTPAGRAAPLGDQTLEKDLQVEPGETLAISGVVTISGSVTISGGGTIRRAEAGAYFSVPAGASLKVENVTVDGDNISAAESLFVVESGGALTLTGSTVQNCIKANKYGYGGAIRVAGGTLTIENTTIRNCSAARYGGAIYLENRASATIKSGAFSENSTTSTSEYGGGFVYNRQSTLIIEGGQFSNNSSAGKGGAIYNTGRAGTATYIRGGTFEGNTSTYGGYAGSGAVFYSSVNTADTVLYIAGSARFGDGGTQDGTDGIYLDTGSNALRKTQLSSALQTPLHIYVACEEGRVIAEGVEDYKLTPSDMTRLVFHDTAFSGASWYAWLNSEKNEVYVSKSRPVYMLYDSNGGTGAVIDNHIYTPGSEVTAADADGLSRQGHRFKGWNTAPDGTGKTYQPGNKFTVTENTTLYAQWEKAFLVTLPKIAGCTLQPEAGSESPVLPGGSFRFTVTVNAGYYKTDGFAVKANGVSLAPDGQGVYTIEAIQADQKVTVEGVEQDAAPPRVTISLGTNQWQAFAGDVTFDLFFKSQQTVTFGAADEQTGVKTTEYYLSEVAFASVSALEGAADGKWTTCSGSLPLAPNQKVIVYARATDGVGNVGYASSQGMVLYTDAAPSDTEVSFTKTGTKDVTVAVTLNGNTVAGIRCGEPLDSDDYTVSGGAIALKAVWLNTLAAGDHTLTVACAPLGQAYVDAAGNEAPGAISVTLRVQKAAGSVTIENDISKTFDGQPVADVEYNAPSTGHVTVEYKPKDASDSAYTAQKPSAVGQYTLRVTVAADENYTQASATADFSITWLEAPQQPFTLVGTLGANGWYTSDVSVLPPSGLTIATTLQGDYSESLTLTASRQDLVVYLKNEQGQMTSAVTVGDVSIDKTAPVLLARGNTGEYRASDTVDLTVTESGSGVEKVEYKTGDGGWQTLAPLADGYSLVIAANGVYTFRVTDRAGLEGSASLTYDKIDGLQPVLEVTAVTDGGSAYPGETWTNRPVTITVQNTSQNLGVTRYEYRVNGGDWTPYPANGLTADADTDPAGTAYEFRATSAAGVESAVARLVVKTDRTAPEGSIQVEQRKWQEFLNTITFGLFFKENVQVTLRAEDAGSGLAAVKYFRSATAFSSVDALEEAAGNAWKTYGKPLTESPDGKFVYYARLTDQAGNRQYLASDGVVLDATPPAFSGAANDGRYYVTRRVTVTDDWLGEVTLNDQAVQWNGDGGSAVLTLPGGVEKDTAYEIVAVDKAGNRASLTVTMQPLAALSAPVARLEQTNVKADDTEDIKGVRADAQAVLADAADATEEEKMQLQQLLDDCAALLDKVEQVEEQAQQASETILALEADSVNSDDRQPLEAAKAAAEKLLAGDNLTETQRQALAAAKDAAEALLGQLEQTDQALEELEQLGEELPGLQTATGNDRAALNELLEKLEALLPEGEGACNLTREQQQELEKMQHTAQELLERLDAVDESRLQLEEAVEKLEEWGGATADDEDDLRALIDQAQALLDSGNLTPEQAGQVRDLQNRVQAVLDRVEGVNREYSALVTAADKYDAFAVTENDRSSLDELVLKTQMLLDTPGLTEAQRTRLENTLTELKRALSVLDGKAAQAGTSAVQTAAAQLPAEQAETRPDEEAETAPALPEGGAEEPVGRLAGGASSSVRLALGAGQVIVTLDDEGYAGGAGVASSAALASAALTTRQLEQVRQGETVEVRLEVKDLSEKVPEQDAQTVEQCLAEGDAAQRGLTLGSYADLSLLVRTGGDGWQTVSETSQPVQVTIAVPEALRAEGRQFAVVRAHQGEYALLEDLDDKADTITFATDRFSTYAIVYTDGAAAAPACGLCGSCPAFLGVCCFVWAALLAAGLGAVWYLARRAARRRAGE